MGLHKWPCPCTHTHTHPHVHAFTHVCLPACVFAHLCVHTRVHTFTRAHHVHGHIHPRVCSLACAVTHTGACAPRHGAVLLPVHSHACGCIHPCACMCSPVCIDVRVPVFPPRSCVLALSMLSANHLHAPNVCACVYSGVCLHIFIHTTPVHMCSPACARAHLQASSHVSAPTCVCIRSHTCVCTRRCVPMPTHTCVCSHIPALMHPRAGVRTRPPPSACAHTRVLVPPSGRRCPCTAVLPALPGVVGLSGVHGGPALPWHGERVPSPAPWCPAGTRKPWGRHLTTKGTMAMPACTTLPCWGEPGHPRASSAAAAAALHQPPGHCHPNRPLPGATAKVPAAMSWL